MPYRRVAVRSVGYEIHAAGIPRMTARETRQREPPAERKAVPTDRRERVLRAARIKAARFGQQRGDEELVEPKEPDDEQRAHGIYYTGASAEVTSARRSRKVDCAAGGRATSSRRIVCSRSSASPTIAAKRRRKRLRKTAFPIALLTVMPTSDDASPGSESLR